MTSRPVPKSGIEKILGYTPGKSGTGLHQKTVKLSSNESALGTSPKALAALGDLGVELAQYPDGSSTSLRKTIAETHGLDAEKIVIGAGSDELLHLLAQAYLGEGDEAVISQYGFLMYPIVTNGAGASPVFAKDHDYRVDVDAMLAAVTEKTRMVFLANPNNPTGTYISEHELDRLHEGLPANVVLIVDNAYAEYVTASDFATGEKLARTRENVVMVRTFSKIGLAALRIGWMFGPSHIVNALNRLRGPFNVNRAAQLAGEAATKDYEFIAALKSHNSKWRDWLADQLHGNQMRVLPSQANFLLVLFSSENDAGLTAKAANQALAEEGLIVREMAAYGLENALRITIGPERAMRDVARILRDVADK